MLLHLIQDCSSSHVIDKIELVAGHKIESCLLKSVPDKLTQSVSLIDASTFVVVEEDESEEVDDSFGRWFVLYILDWVSINCSTRQVEWCFFNKESSHIKYLEDEEYDIDMEEMFDCTQRLIECISDDAYTPVERHEALVQFLHQQVLSLITISQNDVEALRSASDLQEKCIKQLDNDLEMWNNAATAYKTTLANMQKKLEPGMLAHSQIRSLYPEVTKVLSDCLSKEMIRLKRGTVSPNQKRVEEISRLTKRLRKRKKNATGFWKRRHSELLEEMDGINESFLSTDRELKKVRATELQVLSSKIKATQIKEYLRNVQQTLRSTSETYGYDVPSSHSAHSLRSAHYSLYDSVLTIIQDANQDVGREHTLACKWIIEQCKLTEMAWETDPSRIPTATDTRNYDNMDEDYLLISEPDIFTVISERISIQSAYTVGQLIKLLPRIQTSPAATKRLILAYETIIYNRISEYITPLLELRYKNVLDQLSEDLRTLSWEDLDIDDEWIIGLLNTQSPSAHFFSHTTPPGGKTQSNSFNQSPLGISSSPANDLSPSRVTQSLSIDTGRDTGPPAHPLSPGYSDSGYYGSKNSPEMPSVDVTDVILGYKGQGSTDSVKRNNSSDAPIHTGNGDAEQELANNRPATKIADKSLHNDYVANQLSGQTLLVDHLTNQQRDSANKKTYLTSADSHLTNQQPDPNSARDLLTNKKRDVCFEECTDSDDTLTFSANNAVFSEPPPPKGKMDLLSSAGSKRSSLRLDLRCTTLGDQKDLHDGHSKDIFSMCGEGVLIPRCLSTSSTNQEHSSAASTNRMPTSSSTNRDQSSTFKADPDSHSDISKAAPANSSSADVVDEVATDVSTEIDSLLCEALLSLDEKVRKLEAEEQNSVISALERQFRVTSPGRLDRPASMGPSDHVPSFHKKSISKDRSKSVDVKSKGRYKRAANVESAQTLSMSGSSSRPTTPATPQSPRILQIHAQTRKDVESVLLKRRSRKFKSRRSRTSTTRIQTASVVMVGVSLFNELFKESIQCLIDMQLRHSPFEKAQLLAKCLRCMSATISEIRARKAGPTTSDDLVTVAIVLLLNIPTQEFRSVYIQLKFISTYMNEFMDAGIHNFACIQFIGAMQYIQDQLFTKRYRRSHSTQL